MLLGCYQVFSATQMAFIDGIWMRIGANIASVLLKDYLKTTWMRVMQCAPWAHIYQGDCVETAGQNGHMQRQDHGCFLPAATEGDTGPPHGSCHQSPSDRSTDSTVPPPSPPDTPTPPLSPPLSPPPPSALSLSSIPFHPDAGIVSHYR